MAELRVLLSQQIRSPALQPSSAPPTASTITQLQLTASREQDLQALLVAQQTIADLRVCTYSVLFAPVAHTCMESHTCTDSPTRTCMDAHMHKCGVSHMHRLTHAQTSIFTQAHMHKVSHMHRLTNTHMHKVSHMHRLTNTHMHKVSHMHRLTRTQKSMDSPTHMRMESSMRTHA